MPFAGLESRDEEEAATNGHNVFYKGDEEVRHPQRFDQPYPQRIPEEGSRDPAQTTEHSADRNGVLRRCAERGTRQATEDETSNAWP